jgi:hypothetical protein
MHVGMPLQHLLAGFSIVDLAVYNQDESDHLLQLSPLKLSAMIKEVKSVFATMMQPKTHV